MKDEHHDYLLLLGIIVFWVLVVCAVFFEATRPKNTITTGNILGGIDMGTLTIKKYDINRTVYIDENGKEVMVIDETLEIK
jgi:uncharacterized membrane protein